MLLGSLRRGPLLLAAHQAIHLTQLQLARSLSGSDGRLAHGQAAEKLSVVKRATLIWATRPTARRY